MSNYSPKWIDFAPTTAENNIFDTDKSQSVGLPNLIRETAGQYSVEARNKKIDLIIEYDGAAEQQIQAESLFSLVADPADLRFMLSQMLKNSLAQTLEGFIKVRLSKYNKVFSIEVEDSGMGVHPDEKIVFVESVYRGNLCRITYVQDPEINMTKMAPLLKKYGASMQLLIAPGKGMTRRLLLPATAPVEQNNRAAEQLATV